MDKSFNDQELSDIMKEIEALEQDFKSEEDKSEEKMEATSVMEELSQLDEEVAIPTPTAHHHEESHEEVSVIPMKSTPKATHKSHGSTSMSFKVSGDIHLDLEFDIGGKVVSLHVTEAGLNIELDGGMTFTVPLSDHLAHKKSA